MKNRAEEDLLVLEGHFQDNFKTIKGSALEGDWICIFFMWEFDSHDSHGEFYEWMSNTKEMNTSGIGCRIDLKWHANKGEW